MRKIYFSLFLLSSSIFGAEEEKPKHTFIKKDHFYLPIIDSKVSGMSSDTFEPSMGSTWKRKTAEERALEEQQRQWVHRNIESLKGKMQQNNEDEFKAELDTLAAFYSLDRKNELFRQMITGVLVNSIRENKKPFVETILGSNSMSKEIKDRVLLIIQMQHDSRTLPTKKTVLKYLVEEWEPLPTKSASKLQ